MNLEYHVTSTVEKFKSQQIEDENFITVEHRENGITFWSIIRMRRIGRIKIFVRISCAVSRFLQPKIVV